MTKYLQSEPFSVPVDGNDNYERIFGHSGPKVVDAHNNPTKLSSYQKNALYKQAKDAKEKLKDVLCTKTECDIPNERNVQKMLHSEFKHKKVVDHFKQCMKAIGADPRDADPYRLRRR